MGTCWEGDAQDPRRGGVLFESRLEEKKRERDPGQLGLSMSLGIPRKGHYSVILVNSPCSILL